MCRVLPLLTVLCLAFAPAPFPKGDRIRGDLRAMQGTWVLTGRHVGGVKQEAVDDVVWRIQGDRLESVIYGTKAPACFIRLRERTEPGFIDLVDPSDTGRTLGRYTVQGDTLTVCVREGKIRPRELFDKAPSSRVWIMKRQKP